MRRQHTSAEQLRHVRRLRSSVLAPLVPLSLMLGVKAMEWAIGGSLAHWGIQPREWGGVVGILTTPFLHGDLSHLFSNMLPFWVLSAMILYFYREVALSVFLLVYFLTGVLVWAFASWGAIYVPHHIGASGQVYGLAAFITGMGIFLRDRASVALALLISATYSGLWWGVLPMQAGVSWESHLFGALVGFGVAAYYQSHYEADDPLNTATIQRLARSEAPKQYFLPRDTFEKTLAQRAAEQAAEGHPSVGNQWHQNRTWDN